MLPRRVVVGEEHEDEARQLLQEAGLGHELRPGLTPPGAELTDDAVLGGRLRLKQPRRGHRVGHDAILLAAATGARSGDRAVDLGAGVGAAGLALAWRVPGAAVTLVEIDPDLAALAEDNIARNGLSDRVRVLALDATSPDAVFAAAGLDLGAFDHVLMNPPFSDPSRQNVSPDAARRTAHVASSGTLAAWIDAASRLLHSAGALTLIWRADGLADVLAALQPRFGGIAVLPVHGRTGAPAIRVLVHAAKGSSAPLSVLPGLMLNDAAGRPSAEAEAVLRAGQALPMDRA
ncbi:MAG: methyltransferase [Alphaproteobacteria bacterium]|nr:methyltransferase [Alphaproteobacteria bacterium]